MVQVIAPPPEASEQPRTMTTPQIAAVMAPTAMIESVAGIGAGLQSAVEMGKDSCPALDSYHYYGNRKKWGSSPARSSGLFQE